MYRAKYSLCLGRCVQGFKMKFVQAFILVHAGISQDVLIVWILLHSNEWYFWGNLKIFRLQEFNSYLKNELKIDS